MDKNKAKCDDVITKAKAVFLEGLNGDGWMAVSELTGRISDELADAQCKLSSPMVYRDLVNSNEYGRAKLAKEVVKALAAEGTCEIQGKEDKQEIRLVEDNVDQGKDDRSAEAERADLEADVPFHDLANLFPMVDDQAFQELKDDIKLNGQCDDIITYQGKILDGRNRYLACKDLGLKPRMKEWDGTGSLMGFVISKNLVRRHLDESQRAMVAAKMKPFLAEPAKTRMLAGRALGTVANATRGPVRDQAAKIMNVSPRMVDAASKVLKKGSPELVRGVETRQVKVSSAAKLAGLPVAEQKKVVAAGKKAVVAKAKAVSGQKGKQDGTASRGKKKGKVAPVAVEEQVLKVRRGDDPGEIALSIIDYLGEEKAAEVGEALVNQLKGTLTSLAMSVAV